MEPNDTERNSREESGLAEWLPLVRAEFNEMPGMHLTKPQMRRLFGLNQETCDAVVHALERVEFLRCTADNALVRADLDR